MWLYGHWVRAPFSCLGDWSFLTNFQFAGVFRKGLSFLGLLPGESGSYTFHIVATQLGLGAREVQAIGCWRFRVPDGRPVQVVGCRHRFLGVGIAWLETVVCRIWQTAVHPQKIEGAWR